MNPEKLHVVYLEDRPELIRTFERFCARRNLGLEVLKTDGSLSIEAIQERIRAAQAPFILADFQGKGMTARDILGPLFSEGFIPKISTAALYTGGIETPADRDWAIAQIQAGTLAFGINKPWGNAVPGLLTQFLKGSAEEQVAALAGLKKEPFNP